MKPFASEDAIVEATSPEYWPEALRDEPRKNNFPWRLLLKWLIPGLVGAALLLGLYLVLQRQADRQIVLLKPTGELSIIRANGAEINLSSNRQLKFHRLDRERVSSVVPLLGAPQWSPNGQHFAASVVENNKVQVALFQAQTATFALVSSATSDVVALPSNGWSPDGAYLSLIEHDGSQPLLFIVDVTRSTATSFDITLDTRATIDWSPNNQDLLVTARVQQITPTLHIVNPLGNIHVFAPQDGQRVRSDGKWDPRGVQIAYIANSVYTNNVTSLLTGSVWIADSDGGNARTIVEDDLNLAPIWSPRGDFIFFTRHITETESFELYRVNSDGQNLTRIGDSTSIFAKYPFDRQMFLDWSPDGSQLFFLGSQPSLVGADEQRQLVIYRAAYDGAGVKALPSRSQCRSWEPFAVRWAPTSRALLIACPGKMFLHWVDRERSDTRLPTGLFPAWQPYK